ncbi:MAG: hypothetical protein KBD22_01280 [Candidatus Pacebacteria bacterium]|jgi:primosomal protein N' (replication factor Y)|nr:hypothetical protein [Candidatus Paceibacterota bacterium]MBP9770094.1 hypothetical protein [Candidatus Paceibacterota bacterium]
MYIFEILPITKNRFADTLTYFYSEKLDEGQVVKIPFRKKDIQGIILSCIPAEEGKAFIKTLNYKLRPISKIEKEKIGKAELKVLKDASEYYRSPISLVQSIIFPEIIFKYLKEGEDTKKIDFYKKTIVNGSFEKRMSFYKNIIRVTFAKNKNIFISAPTLRDAKKIYEHISQGIEDKCFILHSSLTQKTIRENVLNIMKNKSSLIIGTPQYVFLNGSSLGGIIIENEHKNLYKTRLSPFIDGRIILDHYAKTLEIPLYSGDSFASLSNMKEVEEKKAKLERLENPKGNLKIVYENLGDKDEAPKRHKKWRVISESAIKNIKETLEKNGKIFIYTLRKGLSTMTICRECHKTLSCPNCGRPLVLLIGRDGGDRTFICYGCRNKFPSTTVCDRCGSWNLSPLGIGTDSVSEYIKEEIPDVKLEIVDSLSYDSPEKASRAIEKAFSENKILIGTEMALQAIKEKTDLSIVASADSLLSMPTFDSDERLMSLLDEIGNITQKTFIVQSRIEKDFLILPYDEKKKNKWIKESLADRNDFMFPPYFVHISVIGGVDRINRFAQYLKSKNFDENDINFYFKKGGPLTITQKEVVIAIKSSLYEIGNIAEQIKELLSQSGRDSKIYINKSI